MTITFNQCPKCGHVRTEGDTSSSQQCPACGIYFAKWVERDTFVPPAARKAALADDEMAGHETSDWRDAWRERLLHVPADVSTASLWGRCLLLLFLLVWGIRLAGMDHRDGEIMFSFMHYILLPIHEAGHVLFIPFGEFMTILGGSLFQVLLPLLVAGALLWTNHDAFGACVGLWWTSTSLLDLAPYIHDANAPQLILLGGHTGDDGPHDWIYLLGEFGAVSQSPAYGTLVHHLGAALMLLSLLGAAWSLWRWYRLAGTIRADGTS